MATPSFYRSLYHLLARFSRRIDAFNLSLGNSIAWLTLLMVLLTCVIVALRYGFSQGSIAMQEAVTYMHASVFMLAAAFTLLKGGHVRVDILYREFSPRRKAWVDCVGTLIFLLPFSTFLILISWDFVGQAWRIREASAEAGGIPAVYLLKTLIPVMGVCLFAQGIAEFLRNLLVLVGFSDSAAPTPHHH